MKVMSALSQLLTCTLVLASSLVLASNIIEPARTVKIYTSAAQRVDALLPGTGPNGQEGIFVVTSSWPFIHFTNFDGEVTSWDLGFVFDKFQDSIGGMVCRGGIWFKSQLHLVFDHPFPQFPNSIVMVFDPHMPTTPFSVLALGNLTVLDVRADLANSVVVIIATEDALFGSSTACLIYDPSDNSLSETLLPFAFAKALPGPAGVWVAGPTRIVLVDPRTGSFREAGTATGNDCAIDGIALNPTSTADDVELVILGRAGKENCGSTFREYKGKAASLSSTGAGTDGPISTVGALAIHSVLNRWGYLYETSGLLTFTNNWNVTYYHLAGDHVASLAHALNVKVGSVYYAVIPQLVPGEDGFLRLFFIDHHQF